MDEIFPTEWSSGFLVPIFKAGSITEPTNYRGISITSCLGKLFSLLLNNRLLKFMEENNLLSETQIGFKKNCRTSDHIFVLKCIIEQAKANKKPIYACFVDLKKAFDTVWRAGLFYKMLVVHKISPKFIRVLHNMYGKLQGIVKVNGQISKPFNINVGLRQGCNISPHLFNIYVNELPELLRQARCDPVLLHNKKVNILMYADDML
jgi:hypothetical protein